MYIVHKRITIKKREEDGIFPDIPEMTLIKSFSIIKNSYKTNKNVFVMDIF